MKTRTFLLVAFVGLMGAHGSARGVECGGSPGFSDCLIVHGAYGVMEKGLTEAEEAADKSVSIILPARRFDFFAASDFRTISDIFSILSPITITLQSDKEGTLPPPPAGFVHFTRRGEANTPFGMFAESDRGEKLGPVNCNFPNVSDCVVFRILNRPLIRVLLSEADESAGLGPITFPGLVFDFTEPLVEGGSIRDIGDRLIISPILFALQSDTENGEPLGPPEPGDVFLFGEAARIFNVTFRSDLPEPAPWPLFLLGMVAAVGFRARQRARTNAL